MTSHRNLCLISLFILTLVGLAGQAMAQNSYNATPASLTQVPEPRQQEEPGRLMVGGYEIVPMDEEPAEVAAAAVATVAPEPLTAFELAQKVRLFGYDIFSRFVSADVAEVPLRPDYIVGSGDEFECFIWGREETSFKARINVEGEVIVPHVGPVSVAGLTFAAMKEAVEAALASRLTDFRLTVVPLRQRRMRIYVLGEARQPGVYDLPGAATAYSALFAAGGPARAGSLRDIAVKRGSKKLATIDLYGFLLQGDRNSDVPLQEGDIIHIPLAGTRVAVRGEVRRPAIYELKPGELQLAAVMQMAGNAMPGADISQIRIERIEAHDRRRVFNANLSGKPVAGARSDVTCQDLDVITLFAISPRREEQVVLNGHVFAPGPRPWRPGMKLSELLGSAEMLKRDPYLEYGEIQREEGPGGKLEILRFNPGRLLAGEADADLQLRARDQIRIFSRAEMHEKEAVEIIGEVVKPGRYQLNPGMTLRDLIMQAGGFKLGVDMRRGDLTRVAVVDGTTTTSRSLIDLEDVMAEKTGSNLALNDGDLLAVRLIPEWRHDLKVKLSGEVRYPGEYTFHHGERISTIIERAGGYTDQAWLPGAVFKRRALRADQERQLARALQTTQVEQQLAAIKAAASENGEESSTTLQQSSVYRELAQQLARIKPDGRLVVQLSADPSFAGSRNDIELENGDELHVPMQASTVIVEGAVGSPSTLTWEPGHNIRHYIELAGGFSRFSDRNEVKLIRADGSALGRTRRHRPAHSFLGTRVEPGDTILVPVDMRPPPISGWKRTTNIAQILSSLAITALAIQNSNK